MMPSVTMIFSIEIMSTLKEIKYHLQQSYHKKKSYPLSYPILPYPNLSYPYPTISYPLPYPTPYPTLPYPLPYPILPYSTLPSILPYPTLLSTLPYPLPYLYSSTSEPV